MLECGKLGCISECLWKMDVSVVIGNVPMWQELTSFDMVERGCLINCFSVGGQSVSVQSSNYRPIALVFCLSKAFESVFNIKIMKHLSAHNILTDCKYGFQKGWSTGDLAFLTKSWSSSFRDFGETFAVGLDISKIFDRVWHKCLVSKLSSYGFYPSLCIFISSFLSDRYIAAVVDGHCSSPKTINSDVPQGSVLSLTLFLLFINDLLNLTQCPIHSYADDTTLNFSTSYNRRSSQ